ncbi:unnamed protein product [Rhizophagus irregularis]|nr:unnamed protein product [Rhizophagus irregularis]
MKVYIYHFYPILKRTGSASWPQFYCERPSLFSEFLDDNKSLVCPGEMSVDGRNNLKLCFYVPQEICKNNI